MNLNNYQQLAAYWLESFYHVEHGYTPRNVVQDFAAFLDGLKKDSASAALPGDADKVAEIAPASLASGAPAADNGGSVFIKIVERYTLRNVFWGTPQELIQCLREGKLRDLDLKRGVCTCCSNFNVLITIR